MKRGFPHPQFGRTSGSRQIVLCAAVLLGAFGPVLAPPAAGAGAGAEVRALRRVFRNPPREYASAPLWVWNDLLSEDQIRDTMRDLAAQDVKQVFVHPRPGLMTPYLGSDWFRLWNVALREAARLDMNVWIYDENSYPSGFAGGFVPERMPESRGMGLALKESAAAPAWDGETVAVFRLAGGGAENVSEQVRNGTAVAGEGGFLVAKVVRAGNSPWHGGRSYVNLLTPGVTEKFLEITLGAYDREIGKEYGKRVPGVFTDEPNIRPAGGFPWCVDLPEQFQQRWGYRLEDALPSLVREVGDWRRVRHNYFATLNDLFVERWGRPFYEACERRGLEFTGHYWDHEWPHCIGVPDNMAMAAWQHRPGVDTLMNQYAENTHAQFGNVRYCREISSIANQLGRKRTLVELYGAGGWDLRFEDMKRIADWLQVLGVNTMDEHLSYVTLRGARKRDHPQSFSYHEPWWPAYHVHARYLSRLSAALSQGRQVNRILVLEPTTTAWMYQGDEPQLSRLGDAFFRLLMDLEGAQVEYDLGCEDVLARQGGVLQDPGLRANWSSAAALKIGERRYQLVILPEHTETLNRRTRELLNDFLTAGGSVVSLGPVPTRTDGRPDDPGTSPDPTAQRRWRVLAPGALLPALKPLAEQSEIVIDRAPDDPGILFHHRRELDGGQLLFLVNTSRTHPSRGALRARLGGVERWDPHTGAIEAYPFRETRPGVAAEFELPPSGSLLLFFPKEPREPEETRPTETAVLTAAGPVEVRRVGPNVLTLDYVDLSVGSETRRDLYFYEANQLAWRQHGMPRNPWDSAVQFEDELIRRTFPADSGFEVSYRFHIEAAVPADLAVVLERPDLYAVACNGRPVKAAKGDWWLDKAFGRIPLGTLAQVGENVITLRASPFTIWHEIEPAYVLGSFILRPAERGWIITPDQPLRVLAGDGVPTHGNSPDGTMWLSGGVGYEPATADRAPWVRFDLGALVDLGAVRVWNYNEADVRDLTSRGTARLAVQAGTNAAAGDLPTLGEFELARGDGRAAPPQDLKVTPPGRVRYLALKPLSNHAGVTFPVLGSPPDNGFVGLAEVQFLDREGQPIRGVRVAGQSGELRSHRRTADHLVDGSGLSADAGVGWDRQGHPFYAEGVSYRQRFSLGERPGRLVVALPNWYGAVARVDVNGKEAGWITAPPWECEVTAVARRGDNVVDVTVIGTLKNTLGPHHGGHALGSAWPGMFQRGPAGGPPPGERYATVGYGLFEPFVVRQTRPRE